MSPAKRDDTLSARRRSVSEHPPALRHGREHWVVRWIGAAKRRPSTQAKTASTETPSAQIIPLSWADTFGRPARTKATEIFQPAGAVVRLLPIQAQ